MPPPSKVSNYRVRHGGSQMADSGPTQNEDDRKQAEEALRERDELLRALTEHANDFFRLHDLEGQSVYASPSVERLYGRIPTTLFEYAHPDDFQNCQQWWEKILAGGTERLQA